MLFFWTPDDDIPSGGIKQIYRHVALLNRAGIESRVLHSRLGFKCSWFEHDASLAYMTETFAQRTRKWASALFRRMKYVPDLNLREGRKLLLASPSGRYSEYSLSASDVLVLPEYLGAALADAAIDLPLVIFNQNAHGTFRGCGFGANPTATIYLQPNVLGAIVVSEHNQRYLKHAFDKLEVHHVVNGVDASMFHPNDDAPRQRQVAFMPRRKPEHLEQLINILQIRGALDGWTLAPISGLSESGVAAILRSSFLFMSTCVDEGFGLPPVEAGMAGCLVVGYTGVAADEYFQEGLSERIPQDDVLRFAQTVERTLAWIESDEAGAIARGRAFSDLLTRRYSFEREAESVLAAWHALLVKL